MKIIKYLIAALFIIQGLSAQDSLANRFGVFIDFDGSIEEKLGLKYCLTNNDIIVTQFSYTNSVFSKEAGNQSTYGNEQWNGYSFLLGYKRNVYTFKKINISCFAAIEREWYRSTFEEAVFNYDSFSGASSFDHYVGLERKSTTNELKLGIGLEYFIDDQFSVEILKKLHYAIISEYYTKKEGTSDTTTRRTFSVDTMFFIITYYF